MYCPIAPGFEHVRVGGGGSVAIGRYIGHTGYGGGDLHILIHMAHSRWAQIPCRSRVAVEMRATMVAHLAVTLGVNQSGRSSQ